ncbi:MAG: cation diffusion facilitator family transporter [Pelosinus sp.]|nr:cation diffusion facilitator family transporter [Pelosinus sp.]
MDIRVRTASISVISNTLLVILKFVVGIMMGSVSVMSEAIHSGLDLTASLIDFFSLRQAVKPADKRHAYGHGKIENAAAFVEAILIFIAAIWIIYEAYKKLTGAAPVESIGLGVAVMGISSVVNLLVSRHMYKVGKATDSIALQADATHLATDVITSVGVAIGLLLMMVTGIQLFDPIVAILVALMIIKAAYTLTVHAFTPLLDISLPAEEEQEIVDIINRHRGQFVDFHELRTRKAGSERHIDLHLVVPKGGSVKEAHAISYHIKQRIIERFPGSSVLINIEPCGDECEHCESKKDKC